LHSADWSSSQLEKHQKEIQAQLGNYFLRISSPRLAARVASALHGGEVTLEACFSEEVKSLLGGALLDNDPCKWIAKEDVDVDSPPDTMEPNYELLKAVLALPEKVHGHMEKFEAGLALGEIMGVLKLVRTFSDFLLFSTIYISNASWTSSSFIRPLLMSFVSVILFVPFFSLIEKGLFLFFRTPLPVVVQACSLFCCHRIFRPLCLKYFTAISYLAPRTGVAVVDVSDRGWSSFSQLRGHIPPLLFRLLASYVSFLFKSIA